MLRIGDINTLAMKKSQILLFLGFFLLIGATWLECCAGMATFPGSSAFAASPGESTLPESAGANRPDQRLTEQERALLNELLKCDLQLEKYRREQNLLTERLKTNQELVEKTRAEFFRTQLLLAKERRRLAGLLSFLYRSGEISYLNVILGAKSFAEFVNRGFYLAVLITRQAEIISKTIRLGKEKESQLAQLEQLQNAIAKEKALLAQAIAEIEKIRTGRQQLLMQIRRQSGELAERLLPLAEQWQKVVSALGATMQKISTLPADRLFPDRLTFSGGKFQAEITATTINHLLATAAGGDFKTLSVHITPRGVTITGTTSQPACSFSLCGNFTPVPDGRKVTFTPQSLEINNTPVEKDILAFLAGEKDISWELGAKFPFLKISAITPEYDQIIISLSGNF